MIQQITIDRRDTVRVFRSRLVDALGRSGLNRSEVARQIGIDRSTLSQLLSPQNDRLPRAETVAAIATVLQVSADWLLGLSQDVNRLADILEQSIQIEPGSPSATDERLGRWHAEAAGYKIRYVPTNLPDLVKTPELIRYEFQHYEAKSSDQALLESEDRLAYSRLPETEVEICSSVQALQEFADGAGIWRDLDVSIRRKQIVEMIKLVDEIYPTLRWFLYDGRARYSVPLTVFGPLRAAVYMGQMYFVFNTTEHIRVLTRHFDDLIRVAVVQPPDVADYLRRLLNRLDSPGSR